MGSDWEWGINQGNAANNRMLQGELARANSELEAASSRTRQIAEIGAHLAKRMAAAERAQQSFQEWRDIKHSDPHSHAFDIECAVMPEQHANGTIQEKRMVNLQLHAWAEYWHVVISNGTVASRKDSPMLKGFSSALMKAETTSEVRNIAAAINDVADRLAFMGDVDIHDPHQWVKDRVADMLTTVKWLPDDPTIPDPRTLDGQKGKPIVVQDIEEKQRETDPDYVLDPIGKNLMGVGDMALR